MNGHVNDATNVPHELLLTNRQVAIFRKTFANDILVNLELTKTQTSEIIQSGGFFDKLLGPLMNFGSSLMKNFFQLKVL